MKLDVKRDRDDKKPLSFEVDLGRNTAEAVAKFNADGDPYGDVVYEMFLVGAKMQFRQDVLGWVEELKEAKIVGAAQITELTKRASEWKPIVKHRGKPPLEKALKVAKALSVEEREALIKQLQAV